MTDIRVRFDPEAFDVSRREHVTIRAPRGSSISCKGWHQEAALRLLMNNLDPDVAERPEELVVYGGTGKAARNWECFDAIVRELERKGLMMYGQMTAGSWIYIGSQGIVQGTYETLGSVARKHFDGSLRGRFVLTAGLGGMGGAQPLAATMQGAAALTVEVDDTRIKKRLATRYLDREARDLDHALELISNATRL